MLNQLIQQELERANSIHPPFYTLHDGCGVIREEIEETTDNIKIVEGYLDFLWICVKKDNYTMSQHQVEGIKEYSIKAIEELIQVAAMCEKFKALKGDNK